MRAQQRRSLHVVRFRKKPGTGSSQLFSRKPHSVREFLRTCSSLVPSAGAAARHNRTASSLTKQKASQGRFEERLFERPLEVLNYLHLFAALANKAGKFGQLDANSFPRLRVDQHAIRVEFGAPRTDQEFRPRQDSRVEKYEDLTQMMLHAHAAQRRSEERR